MTTSASFDCAPDGRALRMRKFSQWHLPEAMLAPPYPERREAAVEGRNHLSAAKAAP